jgi:ABC-type transport system involved in multi-copper enzyme maturation permease subunit
MEANAVLAKELRTRMRGWRAPAVITAYLLLLALIAVAVLAVATNSQSFTVSQAASLGATLFALLSLFQMLLLLFITPASTAQAISGERQRQTLDLLLVTRLSSTSIVLGKLVAALSFDVLLLLCALPLFSVVFLFGGVAPEQLAEAYALFLVTVVLIGAAGLCISTVTRRSGAATVLSNIFAFGLTIGLAIVTVFLAAGSHATASNSGTPPAPPLPWPAYVDPLFGLLFVLPPVFSSGQPLGLGTPVAGPFGLPLEVWHYNVIIDLVLAVVLVVVSIATLRPRGATAKGA